MRFLARWVDFPVNKLQFWSFFMTLRIRPWRMRSAYGPNGLTLLLWHEKCLFFCCIIYILLEQVRLPYCSLHQSIWYGCFDTACPLDFSACLSLVSASVLAPWLDCCCCAFSFSPFSSHYYTICSVKMTNDLLLAPSYKHTYTYITDWQLHHDITQQSLIECMKLNATQIKKTPHLLIILVQDSLFEFVLQNDSMKKCPRLVRKRNTHLDLAWPPQTFNTEYCSLWSVMHNTLIRKEVQVSIPYNCSLLTQMVSLPLSFWLCESHDLSSTSQYLVCCGSTQRGHALSSQCLLKT